MKTSTLLNHRELHTTADHTDGCTVNRTLFAGEVPGSPAPAFYLVSNGEPVFAVRNDPQALAEFLAALADLDDSNPFQPSDASNPHSQVSEGLAVFRKATEDLPGAGEWEQDLRAAADHAMGVSLRHARVKVDMGPAWAKTYLPAGATKADQAAALKRLEAELRARGLDAEVIEGEYGPEVDATFLDPYGAYGQSVDVGEEVGTEIWGIVFGTLADSRWQDSPAEKLLTLATKAANDFAASLNAAAEVVPWKPEDLVYGDSSAWCDTWEVTDQAGAERAGRIWAKLTLSTWGNEEEDETDENNEYKNALYSAFCAAR